MKILGLGNALVDILIQLNNEDVLRELNVPKGSMRLISASEIEEVTKHTNNLPSAMASGGSAANTIHGLASLGLACGFIGKVGQDRMGQFYENELTSLNVTSKLLKSETETGRAYTLISPDSERTFATYLGAAVELNPPDIDSAFLKQYDLMHIEGYLVQNTSLIEHALRLAKDNKLIISLDLASYNVVEANHTFLSRIIPEYVDIIFANEEEAKAYTHKGPEESLDILASQVETAIVKVGKSGSYIKSGDITTQITIKPVESIDTTGAGDQYAAGFLYGYSKKLNHEKCGKIGSLLSGKVVQYYGARVPKNLWSELLKDVQNIVME